MQEKENGKDNYLYDAVIICRDTFPDNTIARHLHSSLVRYKIPRQLSNIMPDSLRFYLGHEEQADTSEIKEDMLDVLRRSRFLILVCSPRTPESLWIAKIIETFTDLGRKDKIITLLIEGSPNQSFPPLLREIKRSVVEEKGGYREKVEVIEPLAANIIADDLKSSVNKLKTERLRLLAQMLGCRFDDLRQRHQERAFRQKITAAAGVFCALLLLAAFTIYQLGEYKKMYESVAAATSLAEEETKEANRATEVANEMQAIADEAARKAEERRLEAEEAARMADERREEAAKQRAVAEYGERLAREQEEAALLQAELALDALQRLTISLPEKFAGVPAAQPIIYDIIKDYTYYADTYKPDHEESSTSKGDNRLDELQP